VRGLSAPLAIRVIDSAATDAGPTAQWAFNAARPLAGIRVLDADRLQIGHRLGSHTVLANSVTLAQDLAGTKCWRPMLRRDRSW
jgi:hypothetical protein